MEQMTIIYPNLDHSIIYDNVNGVISKGRELTKEEKEHAKKYLDEALYQLEKKGVKIIKEEDGQEEIR